MGVAYRDGQIGRHRDQGCARRGLRAENPARGWTVAWGGGY